MTEDQKSSRFRQFYDERLSNALWFGLIITVVFTPIFFLMNWGGYRGKFKPWGDPIPLGAALADVPGQAATIFIVTVIALAIFRPWAR